MADIQKGYTFTNGETVTPAKLHALVDDATVADDSVTTAKIANSAITSAKIADGAIVNADINVSAAIAGTKIDPNFGAQNAVTTGTVTAAKLIPTGTSSTGSGMYLPSANVLGFSTDGSERVRIGNSTVGVGTASPDATLHVARGTATGGAAQFNGTTHNSHFSYGTDEHTYIRGGKATSNVYVGDTGTGNVLMTAGGGNVIIGATGGAAVNVEDSAPPIGITGYTNKIHIQAGNDCPLWLRRNNSASIIRFWRATAEVGSISVTTTATSYNTSSDYRLKDNATPLGSGLATINQLQPVEFTWKSDGSIGRGFIAHELQAVVPEAVTGAKDAVDAEGKPDYQGVDASKLVPYLVAAVQELTARVKALEAAR